ncbi:Nucleolar RNA helicase 2 [Trichoplax sp. H2]|nr:Nucleolar RNA helicase 2 [Trichoplax sp. H2]|eukprot:RDD43051.1 Nucleolar RNA helicase 2 [Trichoplax sp. H2]
MSPINEPEGHPRDVISLAQTIGLTSVGPSASYCRRRHCRGKDCSHYSFSTTRNCLIGSTNCKRQKKMIARHFYSAIHLYSRSLRLPRVLSPGLNAWSTFRLAATTTMKYNNTALKQDSSHHFDAPTQHLKNRLQPIDEDVDNFAQFPLDETLVSRLHQLGFNRPFQIQAVSLPYTLNGRDVLGKALTGSGKTLAFALPIIQKLSQGEKTGNPRAIVIAPTRELCSQVHGCIADLSSTIKSVALYGGTAYGPQTSKLRRGADVICATPGRLNDHLKRNNFVLDDVQLLILDEADEMLTPNFREQIEDILQDSPQNKQVLMFGATMPRYIKEIAKKYLKTPEVIDITKKGSPFPKTVTHKAVKLLNWSCRSLAVRNIIEEEGIQRSVVFVTTKGQPSIPINHLTFGNSFMTNFYILTSTIKVEANDLAQKINSFGLPVKPLHSDLSQNKREEIIEAFRVGKLKAIVATDVAARGLDIPETDLVIQVAPPPNGFDFYVHRTGRTGRAGRSGVAVLIYGSDRKDRLFLKELRQQVQVEEKSPLKFEEIAKYAISAAGDRLQEADQRSIKFALPKAQELLQKEETTDGNGPADVLAKALLVLADLPSLKPKWSSDDADDDWDRKRSKRKFSNKDDNYSSRRYENFGKSDRDSSRRRENFGRSERDSSRRRENFGRGDRDFSRNRENFGKGDRDSRRREFGKDFEYTRYRKDGNRDSKMGEGRGRSKGDWGKKFSREFFDE